MHNETITTPAVVSTQPVKSQPSPRLLKLALDVHLRQHVVAMQYDGSSPKPPQRFSPPGLLAWVQKQIVQGWQLVSCYEAGPFGYGLHRQLTALDRYLAGNPHALALVRVPTEAQERQRSESRLRQSLKRDLKLIAQRGRGLAMQYGFSLKDKWYGARNWPRLVVPPPGCGNS